MLELTIKISKKTNMVHELVDIKAGQLYLARVRTSGKKLSKKIQWRPVVITDMTPHQNVNGHNRITAEVLGTDSKVEIPVIQSYSFWVFADSNFEGTIKPVDVAFVRAERKKLDALKDEVTKAEAFIAAVESYEDKG